MAQHASLEVIFGTTQVQLHLEQETIQGLANDIQTALIRAAAHDSNEATKAAREQAANPTQGPTSQAAATTAATTVSDPAQTAGAQSQAATAQTSAEAQGPQVFQGVTGVFVSAPQVAEYRQNGNVSVGSAEVVPQGFTGVAGPNGGLTCTPVDQGRFVAWIDKNFPQQQTNAAPTQTAPQDTQAAHSQQATTTAGAQNPAPQSAGQTGTLSADEFTAQARQAVGNLVAKYGNDQAGTNAAVAVLGQFGHQGFSTVTPDQYGPVLAALQSA